VSGSNLDKIVLISGATGRQGGAVIRHMLPKGWKLRALMRGATSSAPAEFAREGIEPVQLKADIPELRRRYPEVHLQTLEEWLRNEGWHKRARHVRPPKG